jgi:hypothetical protein
VCWERRLERWGNWDRIGTRWRWSRWRWIRRRRGGVGREGLMIFKCEWFVLRTEGGHYAVKYLSHLVLLEIESIRHRNTGNRPPCRKGSGAPRVRLDIIYRPGFDMVGSLSSSTQLDQSMLRNISDLRKLGLNSRVQNTYNEGNQVMVLAWNRYDLYNAPTSGRENTPRFRIR